MLLATHFRRSTFQGHCCRSGGTLIRGVSSQLVFLLDHARKEVLLAHRMYVVHAAVVWVKIGAPARGPDNGTTPKSSNVREMPKRMVDWEHSAVYIRPGDTKRQGTRPMKATRRTWGPYISRWTVCVAPVGDHATTHLIFSVRFFRVNRLLHVYDGVLEQQHVVVGVACSNLNNQESEVK